MSDTVQRHYEKYPYPHYPLLASLRRCDTYALNLQSLWIFSNGTLPPPGARTILVAGCGTFAPYPFALANQDCTVTALDLSQKSLKRARMHCLLHGRRNLRYVTGDLINRSVATGPFGLIDAYGVLHHLKDPLDGLRALEQRLMPGGIMRLMLYSRSARREKESIRHALRLLGVTSVQSVRDMVQRAPAGSRLRSFFETSDEVTDDAGLADALLHPCARTYRIDEVLHLLREAGLKVLRYAHSGALPDIKLEENRLRNLEREQCLDDNFVLYAVRENDKQKYPASSKETLMLNPCLAQITGSLRPGRIRIPTRFGGDNFLLGWSERRFLRRFRKPTPLSIVLPGEKKIADRFMAAMFLLCYK